MEKRGPIYLAYFGAFGTVWALLRDFGIEREAALLVVSLIVGVLIGLRLHVVLLARRNRTHSTKPSQFDQRPDDKRQSSPRVRKRRAS